jgi:hypothetical protein
MTRKYEAVVVPAQSMKPIGVNRWFAQARIRQTGIGRNNDVIRIPGEWHGRTRQEAESKARLAAEDWIAQHTE